MTSDDSATEPDHDAGIAPGVTEGGSPEQPGKTSYSIHDQDPGPLEEPRAEQGVPDDLLGDGPEEVVAPGSGAHERGAGVRSPGGGDDVVANDNP